MEKSTHFGVTPSVHSETTSQLDSASYNQDIEHKSGEGIQESKMKDPNVVDWDGPDDPANPMNWSSRKKVAAIGIVSLITMLS
jgi:hypothetical protein